MPSNASKLARSAWCVGSSVTPLLPLSKPAGAWATCAAVLAWGATDVAKGARGLVEHATAQRVSPNNTNPIKNFMALSRGLISPQIYACSAGTANDTCGHAAPSFMPPDQRVESPSLRWNQAAEAPR